MTNAQMICVTIIDIINFSLRIFYAFQTYKKSEKVRKETFSFVQHFIVHVMLKTEKENNCRCLHEDEKIFLAALYIIHIL
jgi:hypothetical protein